MSRISLPLLLTFALALALCLMLSACPGGDEPGAGEGEGEGEGEGDAGEGEGEGDAGEGEGEGDAGEGEGEGDAGEGEGEGEGEGDALQLETAMPVAFNGCRGHAISDDGMTVGARCFGAGFFFSGTDTDVFIWDRFTETADCATCLHGVGQGTNEPLTTPLRMSADGGRVVFTTQGSLVATDGNEFNGEQSRDVYLYDRVRGARLLSGDVDGVVGAADLLAMSPESADVSGDGNSAVTLSARRGDGFQLYHVGLADLDAPVFTLVSRSTAGAPADGPVDNRPSISDDGRFIAFSADAPSLTGVDGPAAYLHDTQTSTTSTIVIGEVAQLFLSGDGAFAFFWTAGALDAADANDAPDLYRVDAATGQNARWLSRGAGAVGGGHCHSEATGNVDNIADCQRAAAAADGDSVLFESGSAELRGLDFGIFRGDAYFIADVDAAAVPAPVLVASATDGQGTRIRTVSLSRGGRFLSFDAQNGTLDGISNLGNAARIWSADLAPLPPPAPPSPPCSAAIAVGDTGQLDELVAGGDEIAFTAASGAMSSLASVDGDPNNFDVFATDDGALDLISRVDGAPSPANGAATTPSVAVKANGDVVVAFRATGDPTGEDPTPDITHVYLKNLTTGELRLLDHVGGVPVSDGSFASATSISADGSTVAFFTTAPELRGALPSDNYLYVWREATDTVSIVTSAQPFVIASSSFTDMPSLSADGSRIAYVSRAANMVNPPDGDGNGADVLVHDFNTGQTFQVSGTDAASSGEPRLSADGDHVVFISESPLVPADTNGFHDVYLVSDVDGARTATRLVAATPNGDRSNQLLNLCPGFEGPGNSSCNVTPQISADNSRVVFATAMPLDAQRDRNGAVDVYAVDVASGVIALVSRRHDGTAPLSGGSLGRAVISADGARAGFLANSRDLFASLYPIAPEAAAPVLCTMPPFP